MHAYVASVCEGVDLPKSAAIVAAVCHKELTDRPLTDYLSKLKENATMVDVKCQFDPAALKAAGIAVWRL